MLNKNKSIEAMLWKTDSFARSGRGSLHGTNEYSARDHIICKCFGDNAMALENLVDEFPNACVSVCERKNLPH